MMLYSILAAVIGLQAVPVVRAGTVLHETIWGTVIFTLYGDRTPYILPETNVLTPLGAQQLFSAGSAFRDRYVSPPASSFNANTAIKGISAFQLDNDQVTMISTADQFIVASAQAFMQGLYPALGSSSNYTFINGESELANGSNVDFPLHGYQYPQIYTASNLDLNSVWIAGEINCPMYRSSRSEYYASPQYEALQVGNGNFYAGLQGNILNGIFANSSVGYFDAYYIYDYLNYGYVHNLSVFNHLSTSDLLKAKVLADEWAFAMNGNTSASGSNAGDHIRAISGRTLATRVVEALYTNINTAGTLDKMTLMFGSFEPMVAFAALAGLPSDMNQNFYGLPEYGSSMVFELYSLETNNTGTYPDSSNLNVRFLFQNGTGNSAELISYPLFGRGPSQISLSLQDFMAGMEKFMILSVEDWCNTCSSYSVFCPAFGNDSNHAKNSSSSNSGASKSHHGGLKPAVAGVVGAIIALALVGLIVAAAMLLGGVRLYRSKTKRRSELGGFKGGEKLASDQDLTVIKGGAGATVVGAAEGHARGHERVGSWELGDRNKAEEGQLPNLKKDIAAHEERRPSFEDDDLRVNPLADPVKPHDTV